MTPAAIEAAFAKARDEAARNALRARPSPTKDAAGFARTQAATSVVDAFGSLLAEAGGNVAGARSIVEREIRASTRSRQLEVAAFAFETPAEHAERVENARESERRRLLGSAGLWDRYATADVDDLSGVPTASRAAYRAVVAKLRQLLARPGATVALIGPWGPGKTHIASGLVRERCHNRQAALYSTVCGYFKRIQQEFGPKGNATALERRYKRPALLVLDELQRDGYTAWQKMQLVDLLDERYGNLRSTLIVSNASGPELAALLGNIGDRIHDGGAVVEFDEPSLRGRCGERAER